MAAGDVFSIRIPAAVRRRFDQAARQGFTSRNRVILLAMKSFAGPDARAGRSVREWMQSAEKKRRRVKAARRTS